MRIVRDERMFHAAIENYKTRVQQLEIDTHGEGGEVFWETSAGHHVFVSPQPTSRMAGFALRGTRVRNISTAVYT